MLGAPLPAAAAIVLTVDQLTKRLVARRLRPGESRPILRSLRVCHVLTRRGRLALAERPAALTAIWIGAVLALGLATAAEPALQSGSVQLGVGVAIGGTAGNLLDWLRRGCVTDFVAVRRWPAFNLADVAIVTGLAATAVGLVA